MRVSHVVCGALRLLRPSFHVEVQLSRLRPQVGLSGLLRRSCLGRQRLVDRRVDCCLLVELYRTLVGLEIRPQLLSHRSSGRLDPRLHRDRYHFRLLLLLSISDRNRVVQAICELAGSSTALLPLFLPLEQSTDILHGIHLALRRVVGGQVFGHVLAERTRILLRVMWAVCTEGRTPDGREAGRCLAFGCSGLRLEGTVGADGLEHWLSDRRALGGLRWDLGGVVSGGIGKLENLFLLSTPCIECTNVGLQS